MESLHRRTVSTGLLASVLPAAGAGTSAFGETAQRNQRQATNTVREIAKDAYIYGFPLVDSYRIQYSYFVDSQNPEYKGRWNEIHNTARVFTPEDTAIQTPNSDTPYSFVGADLRAEPVVFTVPAVEKGRYYSLQFIDMYTFDFAYVGSRSTGNGAGRFLLAGPDWNGGTPPGIKSVIRCETRFAFVLYRTQLFNPGDIDNVKTIQSAYKVQPLSQFLGQTAPPAPPSIDFIRPPSAREERTSPAFFQVLNFVLQFCPTVPSERAIRARFARIGIGPGRAFQPDTLPSTTKASIQAGMADAWHTFENATKTAFDTGKVSSADVFGTRAFMDGRYLDRMAAAVLGIYGNAKEEALYPTYFVDSAGQNLDGSNHYTLHFAPDGLPPVNAFWSLTLYTLPASLLYANPLNRYLINSPLLPGLKRDADQGITLTVQHESPGTAKEANWLPAPKGPFFVVLRLYWPKPAALDGAWKAPPLIKR